MNEHRNAQTLGDALLRGPEHLDEETIVLLADDSLEGAQKQLASAHLAECDDCSFLVADLKSFRSVAEPHHWETIVRRERRRPSRAAWAGLAAAASIAAVIGVSALRQQPATVPASAPATTIASSSEPTMTQALPAATLARTTMELRDGNDRIELRADGSVTGVPAEHAALVREALTSRALPKNALVLDLVPVASVLRGANADAKFSLLQPVGATIADARPQFSWTALEGATSYRVSVLTETFDPVIESPLLNATTWTPAQDLPRGHTFTWQVAAQTPSGEVVAPGTSGGDAKFHVLAAERALAVQSASRSHSHLVRGLVFAHNGLLRAAEPELAQVASANPKSQVAQSLLASVREKMAQQERNRGDR